MNTLRRTDQFMGWYFQLKDTAIKSRIAARLKQAAMGNFGDHKGVGEGVMEMRIHTGSGIRIYYAQAGNTSGYRHKKGAKTLERAAGE